RGGVSDAQEVFRDVEHAVGKAPFVVEPGQQVDQAWPGDAGLAAIDNRRVRVMVEVAAGVGQFGVIEQPLERACFGGAAQHAVDLVGAGVAGGLQGDVQ